MLKTVIYIIAVMAIAVILGCEIDIYCHTNNKKFIILSILSTILLSIIIILK